MNAGPGKQHGGGGRHRRRRGRRHGKQQQPNGHQGKTNSRHNPDGIYTAPMDHSYRAAMNGNGNGAGGRNGRHGFSSSLPDPDPVPSSQADSAPRIFAFIDDLFFLAKIQETARKLNVKVEFVKTEKDFDERLHQFGEDEKPSLIIFDLNGVASKPLTLIPKLKTRFKKATSIVGYLSHIQGDLKMKAQEAGCDMVVPRSAFSQNLPQLLRRHGVSDSSEDEGQQPSQISIQ